MKMPLFYPLIFCCLWILSLSVSAQDDGTFIQFTPGGTFEILYNDQGEAYSLSDLNIQPSRYAKMVDATECDNSNYFNVYYFEGSGFEDDANPLHLARREVLCQVLTDISNFIPSENGVGVNIAVMAHPELNPFNLLAKGSSFYSIPNSINPGISYSINDSQIWKTINSGTDAYDDLAPAIIFPAILDFGSGFYHGMLTVNFTSVNWHTDLSSAPTIATHDLYTALLRQMLRMLGFVSLDAPISGSLISGDQKYFTRWDSFIQDGNDVQMIQPVAPCIRYVPQANYFAPNFEPGNVGCEGFCHLVGPEFDLPLYNPTPYQYLKSLNYLQDGCSLDANGAVVSVNTTYAASGELPFGPEMNRNPSLEERFILSALDYSVNSNFGSNTNLNFVDYSEPTITQPHVVGFNDSYIFHSNFTGVSNGAPIVINGSDILGNDHNGNRYSCVEVVFGDGQLSVNFPLGSPGTSFSYGLINANPGFHILRYVPYDISELKYGNVTYVVLYVASDEECTLSGCNIISNGGFEEASSACIQGYSNQIENPADWNTDDNQVSCWHPLTGSPDIFGTTEECIGLGLNNLNVGYNSSEYPCVWDIANEENNHVLNLRFSGYSDTGIGYHAESVRQQLANPIEAGEYFISFHSRSTSLPARIVVCGSPNVIGPQAFSLTYSELVENPNNFGLDLVVLADIEIPQSIADNDNDGCLDWILNQENFSYSGLEALTWICIGVMLPESVIGPKNVLIDDFSISFETQPSLEFSLPTVLCNTGFIDLIDFANVPGGYFILDGVPIDGTVLDLTELVDEQEYTIEYIIDSGQGCLSSDVATFTYQNIVPQPISVTANPGWVVCENSTVTLTATGVDDLIWVIPELTETTISDGVSVNAAQAFTYTVTGTNDNGCSIESSGAVTISSLNIESIPPTATVCPGASIELVVNAEATGVNWYISGSAVSFASGNSVIVMPTSETSYVAEGTTNEGCVATDMITVFMQDLPEVTITTNDPNNTVCEGNTIELSASGAATYTWSPALGLNTTSGAFVIASEPGNHSYTVTGESNGCSATATVSLIIVPDIVITFPNNDVEVCEGTQNITLNPVGAVSYSWINNPPGSVSSFSNGTIAIVNPVTTTTYNVSGFQQGCSGIATVTIVVLQNPAILITANGEVDCSGNSITLEASGGVEYEWLQGNQTIGNSAVLEINPTISTGYAVFATDANGCEGSAAYNVIVPSCCIDATMDYYIPGCTEDPTTHIFVEATTYSIDGTVITPDYTFDYSYQWTGNVPFDVNPSNTPGYDFVVEAESCAGEFQVIISDLINGCQDVFEFETQCIAEPLELSLISDNGTCASNIDQSIDITVTGGSGVYEYEWTLYSNPNSILISTAEDVSGLGAGIYTVEVSDAFCPQSITSEQIIFQSSSDLTINTTITSFCQTAGQLCVNAQFGATPYIYYLDGVNEGSPCFEPAEGLHTVTVIDANGCSESIEINVQYNVDLTAVIGISGDCLYPEELVNFSALGTYPGANYSWNFGDNNFGSGSPATHTYASGGTYNVSLSIAIPGCALMIATTTLIIEEYDDVSENINTNLPTDQDCEDFAAWAMLEDFRSISQDIIFGDGVNAVAVTISDVNFLLAADVQIIISENATVNFYRCTFTSCTHWMGFKVRSNSANLINEGRLRMDYNNFWFSNNNFSVIENATTGISVRDERPDAFQSSMLFLRGGLVQCGKTRFHNCKRAFNANYAVDKGGWFKLCQYLVDDEISEHFIDNNLTNGYNQMTVQCRINRSLGYNHYGCAWYNNMTSDMNNWTNRGKAISVSGSSITFTKYSTLNGNTNINGIIEGFDMGLHQWSKTGRIIFAYHNLNKNHIGSYFSGGLGHRVYKNNYTIGTKTEVNGLDNDEEYGTFPGNSSTLGVSTTTSYEGLVIQKADLMEIVENTFEGVPYGEGAGDGVETDYPRIGIRLRATNTEEMVVRKNTLSNLNYGNLANADNAGGTGTSGLRYICNINNNNLQDFTNTDFVGSPGSATIGMVQQEPEDSYPQQPDGVVWPTGNILSEDLDMNDDTYIHFRNEGVGVEYWHLEQLGGGIQTPEDYIGIALESQPITHQCPSKYSTPIIAPHTPAVISGLVNDGLLSKADANQYLYVYLLLLDDGNTAALQQFVADTWCNQVWSTREQLLNISPFISSTVMISVLDNTQVYPHAIAFELMMANPDLLNDPRMVDYLSLKADPMPQYLINLLLAFAAGGTTRSEMEKELASKRTGHINKVSEALWAMMDHNEDDTYTETDFENVIEGIGTLNTEMVYVEMLLERGDIAGATSRANNIPSVVPFGKGELHEYTLFKDWINLRIALMTAGKDWEHLTNSELSLLATFAADFDTYAATDAISVLNDQQASDYFIPPAYGRSGITKRSKVKTAEISSAWLNVYPNPADFLLTISLREALPTQEMLTLFITDAMGRAVHQQQVNPLLRQILVDTGDWPVGLYVFNIVIPNSNIELNGKFDVVH